MYDYNLLQPIAKESFLYIHSKNYDYKSLDGWNEKAAFSYNSLSNSKLKAISYVLSYLYIFTQIAYYRPSVIHIQWFKLPWFDWLFIKLTQTLFHTKMIFTAHNVLPHNTGDKYAKIYNKLYQSLDCIIVHTVRTKEEIATQFDINDKKIKVIPHGILQIDINKATYQQSLQEWDEKYQLKNKIVITSLGEQSWYKGIDLLAEVWAKTSELANNQDLRLIVAGKQVNIDLTDLKNCKNTVVENRSLSNEEFYYLLKHTDVYILPYRNISQSGALLTAMSTHTPIAATNIGGLCDPLKIANVGWTIPTATFKDIQKVLKIISQSKEHIEKIKNDKQVWKRVNTHFDWSTISNTTMATYQKIMS